MKKEVSPAVMIGVGVIAAIVLVFFAMRALAPHPPPVTIPPAEMQNEGAMKRANIQKQATGQASGGDANAAKTGNGDRTGD